jgi:hypothetical protein
MNIADNMMHINFLDIRQGVIQHSYKHMHPPDIEVTDDRTIKQVALLQESECAAFRNFT